MRYVAIDGMEHFVPLYKVEDIVVRFLNRVGYNNVDEYVKAKQPLAKTIEIFEKGGN